MQANLESLDGWISQLSTLLNVAATGAVCVLTINSVYEGKTNRCAAGSNGLLFLYRCIR